MTKIKAGVFSPNDFRKWVRDDNLELMLKHERLLVEALRRAGVGVVRGGDGFPRPDQIAWNTDLVKKHIKKIARARPDILIINQGSWTFPYDSVDAVKYFRQETGEPGRVVMFCYKDTTVPGLVAGMAAGGGLKRVGWPYQLCYGLVDKDPKVIKELMEILSFYQRMADSSDRVRLAIQRLGKAKYLALGGMSLKMPTTTADVDQWQKLFGISYEALDQSELKKRALLMAKWSGRPGESECRIKDKRLAASVDFLYRKKHGRFDFSRDKLKDINKFIYQLSLYWAMLDLCAEYGTTFAGVKCQDELSAADCTACLAAAYLNNDVGPDGKKKNIIPVACENDMDSALTQLIFFLLTGRPAGFGDFRDVEKGMLAIVNCGQHPPYFFGRPNENAIAKLNRTEYLGQEIFYDAGGSSVRGRTPGGEVMTIARLGRENLRYQIVATVIKTVPVSPKEHGRYNPSWPIIKGKLAIPDRTLIDIWPCNHLGFAYGDLTPEIVEMASRLGIGYRVFSATGREYFKAS